MKPHLEPNWSNTEPQDRAAHEPASGRQRRERYASLAIRGLMLLLVLVGTYLLAALAISQAEAVEALCGTDLECFERYCAQDLSCDGGPEQAVHS